MTYKLDEKDKKIIEILEEHADFTTRQIAKQTLLPTTTIHNRIKKLKKLGIIKKFTIVLDDHQVDRGYIAHILIKTDLRLLKQKKKTQHDVASDLKKLYFVYKVDIVSGGTDIIVLVKVRDVKEFDKILLGKLQLVEGIENTTTLTVIH